MAARPRSTYLATMDSSSSNRLGRKSSRGGSAPGGVIYIVDDDDAVRDSLELLVMAEGVDAEGYASAAEFLAAVDPTRPASLVLDLHMPGSGGFDVMAALAARGIDMPVVLISGRVDAASRDRAIASGVRAVLEKPLDCRELLSVLNLG